MIKNNNLKKFIGSKKNKEYEYICKVCKNKFKLIKKNKYIALENNGINGTITGKKKYECFDCPHCGCQNIVNVREG